MIPAKSRPDFTGVWEMSLERSIVHGAAPQRLLVIIEHREPSLIQQILFTNTGGTEQGMTFRFETDAETTNSVGDGTLQTRARWEGMELVIESRMKTLGREAYFKEFQRPLVAV